MAKKKKKKKKLPFVQLKPRSIFDKRRKPPAPKRVTISLISRNNVPQTGIIQPVESPFVSIFADDPFLSDGVKIPIV